MRFSIPRASADRLSRLALACIDDVTPLGHIGVRISTNAVRFSATDQSMLASVVVPLEKLDGAPGDVVLDRDQFTAAMKVTAKGSVGRIEVAIDEREARFSNGTSAIVSRIKGVYPEIGHVWTSTTGKRWVPSISTLDPARLVVAQKIAGGRFPLLFQSPVDAGSSLEQMWNTDGNASASLELLRKQLKAACYWADHELAILLMPISRGTTERQLNLLAHATVTAEPVAAAAA